MENSCWLVLKDRSYHGKESLSNYQSLAEHCINSIREFIMCKADMTPIVLVPPEKAGVPVPVPEFRTKHVCRDFGKISDWVRSERNANLPDKESLEIAKRIREKTGTRY
jgi:Mycotoxin biosynthesis protein UstYa